MRYSLATPKNNWLSGMCGNYLYEARNARGMVQSREIQFSNVNGIL